MKLYYSQTSPFVRKVLVTAHELDLADRIEIVPAAAHPVTRDRSIILHNPLGQVPTLITDDGGVLYDSRVICEYLNDLVDGDIVPADGDLRWPILVEQSLADGMLDAAVIARYEIATRPQERQWGDWLAGQLDKIACGLADLERRAAGFGDRVDIGSIAFACALGYLDFRFASLNWRDGHPNTAAWFEWFGGRDSMVATRPPAG